MIKKIHKKCSHLSQNCKINKLTKPKEKKPKKPTTNKLNQKPKIKKSKIKNKIKLKLKTSNQPTKQKMLLIAYSI